MCRTESDRIDDKIYLLKKGRKFSCGNGESEVWLRDRLGQKKADMKFAVEGIVRYMKLC